MFQKRIGAELSVPQGTLVVGKLFIDIADIYCFGTGLPISESKHVFQYRHFK